MQTQAVHINFRGGIVSPGYLKEIMQVASDAKVSHVRFGLRQQMILEVPINQIEKFNQSCACKDIISQTTKEALPNIVSSYPAAGIFSLDGWLREGVYKDVFDSFNYSPTLKINICDRQQSFTPFFTGHINWVSSSSEHFWQLYVRLPKTKTLHKWKDLIYTNDLPMLSKRIEEEILNDKFLFYGKEEADVNLLYQRVKALTAYVSRSSLDDPTIDFSLPYYEGFNKANNQLWLGVYRRDEQFPVGFLLDVCDICLGCRIGQLYTTSWKSIIIRGINPAHRKLWDQVLGKYRINVRHAANELNWQVEDNSEEGLQIKRQIIRHFDKEDVRTYGLCFAVQTKPASSMFGTIVIQKEQTRNPHRLRSLERFTILYRRGFNPNEREFVVFREGVSKEHLAIYLESLCKYFYEQVGDGLSIPEDESRRDEKDARERTVYQCRNCYTIYDPAIGDDEQKVLAGTTFDDLPETYACSLCGSSKGEFIEIKESALNEAEALKV
ncbi:MAG TPA: rubredoxin [Flavisolibacter sp.]